MIAPQAGRVYVVELCSGERRSWRYLGTDATQQAWWRDCDDGREFNESSLMYAWRLITQLPDDTPKNN